MEIKLHYQEKGEGEGDADGQGVDAGCDGKQDHIAR